MSMYPVVPSERTTSRIPKPFPILRIGKDGDVISLCVIHGLSAGPVKLPAFPHRAACPRRASLAKASDGMSGNLLPGRRSHGFHGKLAEIVRKLFENDHKRDQSFRLDIHVGIPSASPIGQALVDLLEGHVFELVFRVGVPGVGHLLLDRNPFLVQQGTLDANETSASRVFVKDHPLNAEQVSGLAGLIELPGHILEGKPPHTRVFHIWFAGYTQIGSQIFRNLFRSKIKKGCSSSSEKQNDDQQDHQESGQTAFLSLLWDCLFRFWQLFGYFRYLPLKSRRWSRLGLWLALDAFLKIKPELLFLLFGNLVRG